MKRIFLVEDDLEIAKNLMRLLHAEGFGVVHAPTQRAAASLLAGNPFDLALVDISLPDGNGFAVCTEIKQAQDIPVIFLTASGDEASVVTGLNMGADDYITKPFRPRELIARIGNALRKSGRAPSAFQLYGLWADTASGIVKKGWKRGIPLCAGVPAAAGVPQQPPSHPYAGPADRRAVGCSGRICQ